MGITRRTESEPTQLHVTSQSYASCRVGYPLGLFASRLLLSTTKAAIRSDPAPFRLADRLPLAVHVAVAGRLRHRCIPNGTAA